MPAVMPLMLLTVLASVNTPSLSPVRLATERSACSHQRARAIAPLQTALQANCPRADGSGFDCLVQVGLMDGTVWREVLLALEAEGAAFAPQAESFRALMRNRTLGDGRGWAGWNVMDNPAGSEFSWDTTGQEEVAVWGAVFNASDSGWMHGELNARTVDSILGYMAALPTWAYHGAAYGMGDFSNNAKWSEPKERQRERAAPRHDVAG